MRRWCPGRVGGQRGCHHRQSHQWRGAVTSGSSNVLIGGVPAAHLGDTATCLFLGIPTVGTILQGSPSVRINGQPAARVGSPVGTPTPCVISGGNNSVSVGP